MAVILTGGSQIILNNIPWDSYLQSSFPPLQVLRIRISGAEAEAYMFYQASGDDKQPRPSHPALPQVCKL